MKRIKRIGTILLSVLLFATLVAGCTKKSPTNPADPAPLDMLTQNGESEYRVLLSEKASPAEQTAANEIVDYVNSVTGVMLTVVRDNAAELRTTCKYISIGENKLKEYAKIDNSNLNSDGYVLKKIRQTVFIVGECDRATLYGAYDWLERTLGVKFLSGSYEYIPEKKDVALENIDVRRIPAFESRSVYYDACNEDIYLGPKLGFATYYPNDNTAVGGTYRDRWCYDMHTTSYLVDPAERVNPNDENDKRTMYDVHPEWWSAAEKGCPCFSGGLVTNYENGVKTDLTLDDPRFGTLEEGESFIRLCIERVKTYIVEHPDVRYVILGQPDNNNTCNCDKCKAELELMNNNRSAQYMLWINRVAEEVQKWIAEENIDHIPVQFARTAYVWTEAAPVTLDASGKYVPLHEKLVPRDDVYIVMCPAQASFIHPVFDPNCETNKYATGAYFEQWKTLTNKFAIFDYNVDFFNYLNWFPNLAVIQQNIQYYYEGGAIGYIMEGAGGSNNWYQQDMECYVIAKLMWDPYQDINALISEFNRYYYGEIGGKIADKAVQFIQSHFVYQSEVQSPTPGHGRDVRIYTGYNPWILSNETLNPVFLNAAYDYMDEIRESIVNDGISQAERDKRIANLETFEVQIDFMRYVPYIDKKAETLDRETYDFAVEFYDKLARNGIRRFSEGGEYISEIRKQLGF